MVLVYPEIGMDPRHQVLAALRLAPLQCVLYGHPATSGSAQVDYFLSGAEIEPANADAQYREKLIRLPGIGAKPALPPEPGSASWLDPYATGAPLLLCLQNFIKLVPSFDDVLARIAAQSGSAHRFLRAQSATHRSDSARASNPRLPHVVWIRPGILPSCRCRRTRTISPASRARPSCSIRLGFPVAAPASMRSASARRCSRSTVRWLVAGKRPACCGS